MTRAQRTDSTLERIVGMVVRNFRLILTVALVWLVAHGNALGECAASERACIPFGDMEQMLRDLEERSSPDECPHECVVDAVACTDSAVTIVSMVHGAATMELDTALSLLLRCGADVNARDVTGNTPLVSAIWSGALSSLELLLAHGGDPNLTNLPGWTAVHHLVAVAPHRKDMLDRLVVAGADVDRQDMSGATVLHLAAAMNDSELVRSLLQHGADVNVGGEAGATALHAAAANCDSASVRLLLNFGADVTKVTENGRTPAQVAAMAGCAGLIEELGGEATMQ